MIANLCYFNGKKRYDCSLIKRIGDNALILLRTKNGMQIKLMIKFDLISVANKSRNQNKTF